jgi:hypothetical protein
MDEKTYNGWTNYETWNWKLWIDNDQGTQQFWQEQAQNAWDYEAADKYSTRQEVAVRVLANKLKADAEDNNPLPNAGAYTDLLGAALSEINWHEIAESLIEDVDKDIEAEA